MEHADILTSLKTDPTTLLVHAAELGQAEGPSKSVGTSPSSGRGRRGGKLELPYMFGAIKRSKAERLLAANNGLAISGKFLIRAEGDSVTNYLLSVVYKGAATHHALVQWDEDVEYTINGKTTGGAMSIPEAVQYLRNKRPGWPVPLTVHVINTGETAATEPATASEVGAKASDTDNQSTALDEYLEVQSDTEGNDYDKAAATVHPLAGTADSATRLEGIENPRARTNNPSVPSLGRGPCRRARLTFRPF